MSGAPPWRNQNSNTAYTSVSAKTSLSASTNTNKNNGAKQKTSSNNDGAQWPDSLRRFVERCLSEVQEKDNAEMQKQLKEEITKAFEEKRTWDIDWDKKSLPILELRKSQKRKASQRNNFNSSEGVGSGGGMLIGEDSQEKKEKRQRRFESHFKANSSIPPPPTSTADKNQPIVGRSTQLEKQYFRLTSEPDPDMVRSLETLKRTLDLLKRKWKEEQNYAYICDQFKSLRQDLTIQHIQNEFTVSVYEIHARIALEKGDLGEYNQCQSQLKQLYSQNIKGNTREFLAYRILYLLHTQNRLEISHLIDMMINDDDSELQNDPSVNHALKVNSAMACGDYHRLFQLYADAPNMGGYVMDCFINRERLYALSAICRAYRPTIPVAFLTKELGFQEQDHCVEFLEDLKIEPIEFDNVLKIQTKESFANVEIARQNAFKKVDIKGQI